MEADVFILISYIFINKNKHIKEYVSSFWNNAGCNAPMVLFTVLIVSPLSSAGETVHKSVGNIFTDDPTIGFGLEIYSATTPDFYPTFIFLTGLNGIAPATSYTQMLTTIAIYKIENIKTWEDSSPCRSFSWLDYEPNDGAARLFAEHIAIKGVIPNMTRLGFLSHS